MLYSTNEKYYAHETQPLLWKGGRFTMEQGSNITEGEIDVTTVETERLIRWLIEHGHTYEEAYECIAFMAGKTDSTKK